MQHHGSQTYLCVQYHDSRLILCTVPWQSIPNLTATALCQALICLHISPHFNGDLSSELNRLHSLQYESIAINVSIAGVPVTLVGDSGGVRVYI